MSWPIRALILGGTGMLGRAVAAEGRDRRQPVLALSRRQADIRDRDRVISFARSFRPQLVVNCAAFTRVDACQEKREAAMEINGWAVANVVAAAAEVGARLIHVSTDYVFDGKAEVPYPEDAEATPLSVYGESKLVGEGEALRGPGSLVVRTSWLFGPGGRNFVAAILRLIEEGRSLRVVADQVGCPTYTRFLARAIWDLAAPEATGILHYRNRDPVSWHGFAEAIVELWDQSLEVVPIPTDEMPRPAPRPAYSVLDVSRFEASVGRRVEPWGWGLADYLDAIRRQGASR